MFVFILKESVWRIAVMTPWWCCDMEMISALLALCEGNPPVTGGFPSQRAVMWSFDVFFDVRLSKLLMNSWAAGDLRCHMTLMWHYCYAFATMYCVDFVWGLTKFLSNNLLQLAREMQYVGPQMQDFHHFVWSQWQYIQRIYTEYWWVFRPDPSSWISDRTTEDATDRGWLRTPCATTHWP